MRTIKGWSRSKLSLLFIAFAAMIALPAAAAIADVLQDEVTAGNNAKTIATGAANSFENSYWIRETGSGVSGCDVDAANPATFKLTVPDGVTATTAQTFPDGSPKLVFSSCGTSASTPPGGATDVEVTFSSDQPGVYEIPAQYVSGGKPGASFNVNDAKLNLTVFGVSSVSPADGATGVAVGTNVTATFPADPTGLSTSTFKLVKDGTTTALPAAVTYNSTNKTATLNPNSDLEQNTTYNATISGLTRDGVTLVPKNWSFTTAAPPPPACTNPADPTFSVAPDGSNGWYKTTPTVSASSPTGTVQYSLNAAGPFSSTAPTLSDGQTTVYAKAISGTCSSGVSSQLYKVDTVAPSINDNGPTPTSPNGLDNWYTSAVLNQFTASDATSGIPASFTNPFTQSSGSAEGSTVTINSGPVSDVAGNIAAGINSAAFKIDLSDPTNVRFINGPSGGPSNGATYNFGQVPAAPTCDAEDAISGFWKCEVTDSNAGGTNAVGSHTLTATAYDNAGRTATTTLSYTVNPYTLSGFFQPVDMGQKGNTTLGTSTGTATPNAAKAGQTVPLKFEIFRGSTELTDTSEVKSFVQKVTCGTLSGTEDAIETYASGSTSLRYDTTSGQFIFNWQTPKTAGDCYKVTMTAQDNSFLTAFFTLKK